MKNIFVIAVLIGFFGISNVEAKSSEVPVGQHHTLISTVKGVVAYIAKLHPSVSVAISRKVTERKEISVGVGAGFSKKRD